MGLGSVLDVRARARVTVWVRARKRVRVACACNELLRKRVAQLAWLR